MTRKTEGLTTEALAAIRKRAEAAFDGPWHLEERWSGLTSVVGRYPFGDYDAFSVGDCLRKQDADFIAAARTDIPALLAEVERLRGIVDALPHIVSGDIDGALKITGDAIMRMETLRKSDELVDFGKALKSYYEKNPEPKVRGGGLIGGW